MISNAEALAIVAFERARHAEDWLAAAAAGAEWAGVRTAERRALMTPEQRAVIDAVKAAVPELTTRWFMGPPVKGRQPGIIVTPAELAEWEAR